MTRCFAMSFRMQRKSMKLMPLIVFAFAMMELIDIAPIALADTTHPAKPVKGLQVSFFVSSSRRHTRFDCDWSSDVCSSDLRPDVKPSIRALPSGRAGETGSAEEWTMGQPRAGRCSPKPPATDATDRSSVPPTVVEGTPAVDAARVRSPRAAVRPLSAERYEIRFTADSALREKLRQAQDLLAGTVSAGELAEV